MVRGIGAANAQIAKFTISDAAVSSGSSPSAATLTAETQSSVTFTGVDNYIDTKVALTTVPTANQALIVALKFQTTGWTASTVTTWQTWILWE